MNTKIRNSTIISLVIASALIALCYFIGNNNKEICLNLIVFLFGSTLGWFAGTMVSPYDMSEEGKFKTYIKSITFFISGYLIGKIDSLLSKVLSVDYIFSNILAGFKVMMFLTSFITALLITYIYRTYYNK